MNIKKYLILLFALLIGTTYAKTSDPVSGLAERVCPGSSTHFAFRLEDETSEKDYFELSSEGGKIKIAGNNWISVATGFNWYLKYYAHANITWGNMKQTLVRFPKIDKPVRHETSSLIRYYFSYNTFTYSTPFWDWKRWQEEIDFMAMHGINTPLALTGSHAVWISTLEKLGYSRNEALGFVGDATHQAQVLHGVMEGKADSISDNWFANQVVLARKILQEYEKWGMTPVLPGFSGIVPSNFKEKTGADVKVMDNRPAILNPDDPMFAKAASIYYEQLHKLLGKSLYYSMDPIATEGISDKKMGYAIWKAMDNATAQSIWVTTGWKGNPTTGMIDGIPAGKLLILDNESESRPMWGDKNSPDYSKDGYLYHNWIYCQKLNYGGRTGMYGKIQRLIDGYFKAVKSSEGRNMSGVGGTMDAVGNNPVMWELLYELPWRESSFHANDWIKQFVYARYGHTTENVQKAWGLILETLYSPDSLSLQEGPSESVFCARPALSVSNVSKKGTTARYYDTKKVRNALELMLSETERFKYSDNYGYDIQQLAATVNSDYALELLEGIDSAFGRADTILFQNRTSEFLNLLSIQNTLMNCRAETMVGHWIEQAMACGTNLEESNIMRKDARRIITTWGNRNSANISGMSDYSYREWGGLLADFYYERWRSFFSYIQKHHTLPTGYDYFDMENDWVEAQNPYSFSPTGGSATIARHILNSTK